MNLRNWGKEHTLGLMIGIGTTLVSIFVVIVIYSFMDHTSIATIWKKFMNFYVWTSKILSLASIGNLIWFHLFMKNEKWNFGMGIIMATVINLFIILYYRFILM